jgi:hypothetical protein
MQQDKLLELLNAQFRWNRLPALTSSHPEDPQTWTSTDPAAQTTRSGPDAARRQI